MKRERLDLALERLTPGQWQRFEVFASEYFAAELPQLHTMASGAGDRGRDSELFRSEGRPTVMLQYSIAKEWVPKIGQTAARIRENFPQVSVLIYVTNQIIGASADGLKAAMSEKHGMFVDIRDRGWFLERRQAAPGQEAAAESLAADIVDPYLASAHVFDTKGSILTSTELRAAFTYLTLQWEDDTRDKGLTRLCFEALVRAALRETSSESRMSRDEVRSAICVMLPAHPVERLHELTDSALHKLDKKTIRHWTKLDEFCLTYDERQRLLGRLETLEHGELALDRELAAAVAAKATVLEVDLTGVEGVLSASLRRTLDKILLERGEAFAQAVATGGAGLVGFDELQETATLDLANHNEGLRVPPDIPRLIAVTIEQVLLDPGEEVTSYLHSLAATYTLFAFLKAVPDVQAAVVKMFSHGDIWLDTSVVLPLFAEQLVFSESRQFSNLLTAASEIGISLYITEGILDEIDSHIHRSILYSQTDGRVWRSRVPFLFATYALTGRASQDFSGWAELFRGSERPRDDVREWLRDNFDIRVKNLQDEAARADTALRAAVRKVWAGVHERRRMQGAAAVEPAVAALLIEHDVETFLGVVQRRANEERESPYGYSSWLLTLDHVAYGVLDRIRQQGIRVRGTISPVMTPDFLANYIAIGPRRDKVTRATETLLPLMSDLSWQDFVPKDLKAIADEHRARAGDMPEYLIRRKVRDELDRAHLRFGKMIKEGQQGATDRLQAQVRQDARPPKGR